MLNTYIKNRGTTKTLIHDNNHNHVSLVNWDADFDGDIANISISTNTDGNKKQFDVQLDKQDLANILNVPSVEMPLDKRLKMDFQNETPYSEPYFIELPTPKLEPIKPRTITEIPYTHLSSPRTNEELIVPLTLDKKTIDDYYLTPRRRHRRKKTHVTHRVYKKPKSRSKSRSSRRKSRSSVLDLL